MNKMSFDEILFDKANSLLKIIFDSTDIEPFANLSYQDELGLKNESLLDFWTVNKLPGSPESIEPSPKQRNYRTTSKRRVISENNKFYLTFSNNFISEEIVQESILEPNDHFLVYNFLGKNLNKPAFKFLAKHINFLIIRGNYLKFSVIFNVDLLNATIIRKLKSISEDLQDFDCNIVSAFMYFDPSGSDYYFESKVPKETLQFKKLFGKSKISVTHDEIKYFFHPTSFSQINESMIPVMLQKAHEFLKPVFDVRLIDLYCGYGLFSYYFGNGFGEIFGIDHEGEAIRSAIESLEFYKGKSKIKFEVSDINDKSLQRLLPKKIKKEVLVLDPPRQGTKINVIKTLSERKPEKVLHVFCGINEIKRYIDEWEKNKYTVKKVIPLDMFPGTPNIETMVYMEKR